MNPVLGVIAEYNPFHNGHLLHLQESKKISKSMYSICVMSGNFTQRGNVSIVDKWAKTEMALASGIDLVIELPTLYSISSAENFADGAIRILDSLKIVDTLSFGSEIGDIDILDKIATILCNEPKEYVSMLKYELSKGSSYAAAREKALLLYIGNIRSYSNVLSNPNNILGIEYLKALKRIGSPIYPMCIKRDMINYNDTNFVDSYGSSTGIRNALLHQNYKELKTVMPFPSYSILMNKLRCGEIANDIHLYEKEILYCLRKMPIERIANLPDVSEGLENLIKAAASTCNNIDDFIETVKSKRYAQTRLQRILLYALLDITKKDMTLSKKIQPYIRVLGFNCEGKRLLSNISQLNPELKIITSVKKFQYSNFNKSIERMLDIDMFATNTYTLGYNCKSESNLDYTKKIIEVQ